MPAEPNYNSPCTNCGQLPTVRVTPDEEGGEVHDTGLCGPCCFGEAAAIDPDNW